MRSYPIKGDVQAARLSRRDILNAAYHGRRDGRPAAGATPDQGWLGGGNGAPEEAWTPFIGQVRDQARATSSQMIAWLLERHAKLIQKIYGQAETIVREHDVERMLTDGARGRFVASLNIWRTAVTAARARADAAADHANQLIYCYWQAFLRAQRASIRVASSWQPGRAVIDGRWAKADPLLLLSFGDEEDEATAQAGRTLRRALEIIADCDCPMCSPPPPGDDVS